MRAVVQRVRGAHVDVDGDRLAELQGPGLLVLVGVTHTDSQAQAAKLAAKVWGLRLFDAEPGSEGPRELSASDLGLPLVVVSQFTLYGATNKGRRPTWDAAAPGPVAEPLVDAVVHELRALGATVHTGRFGAHMEVGLVNDGPMTLVLDVE